MERGSTGRYESTAAGGEVVRAFVPAPLPPVPPLLLDGQLHRLLENATLAVGRLDAVSSLLPDKALFLYGYVRKEAVLSSQIEGTQSTLSDLLLFELDEAPGVPLDDVVEVSNYVAALTHGVQRLRAGFPLSNRLLREMHGVLLSRGRGSGKEPGEFRRSQNWIGGSRPGTAHFVPPPPHLVEECMSALETFLHTEGDGIPTLVRAGLAHVQFETVHPFLDGNGRLGRLLIAVLLHHTRVLHEPILYLSLYLKENRDTYYTLLDRVRTHGEWEEWMVFFLEGVRATSESAVATAHDLAALFVEDRAKLESLGRRTGSALRVHDALKARPITSVAAVSRATGLAFPTVSVAMQLLVDAGIAREMTGRRRNRLFAYTAYVDRLSDGAAAPRVEREL